MIKLQEFSVLQTISARNLTLKSKKHRLEAHAGKRRRNRSCTMSDSEIISILLCFHLGSFRNFKHYYLHGVGEHLKSDFPEQLSYSRFIQMEHRGMIESNIFFKYFVSNTNNHNV